MKARQRIASSSFEPDQVKAMGKALDQAWARIAPRVDDRPAAREAARLTLADIILNLSGPGNFDPEWLGNRSAELMLARLSGPQP